MSAGRWQHRQAATILQDLQREHGAGWSKLSREQRDAYKAQRVLSLLLTQCQEEFGPAQALVRSVLGALEA